VILEQVSNGIAIRMAVIAICLGAQNRRGQKTQGEGGGMDG
jgi:aspartate carbamoyltransferase catalytic subunit